MDVDRNEFTMVIRAVVASQFPDELMAFDLGAPRHVERLFTESVPASDTGGPFQFDAQSLRDVLSFVVLLNSAFVAVKSLAAAVATKFGREQKEAALESAWKKELLRHGLPEQACAAIASTFASDLASVVSNKP